MKFIHIHTHSHYSLLDGLAKIDELVDRASEFGMDSLALTDHGVMYGAIEFYQKAKAKNIKPIIGVEVYMTPESRHDKNRNSRYKKNHLILLAKSEQGYKNLIKLTTLAHLEGFYYKPRIDKEILKKYSRDIIATSACLTGKIPRTILSKNMEKAEEMILEFQEIFGRENFYLELQHHPKIKDQEKVNKALIELSKKTKAPLVATNDVHYIYPSDNKAQDILLCIQTNKTVHDKNRLSMVDEDFSMKSPEEMIKNFSEVPEAIDNTQKIASECNLEIKLGEILLPHFDVPNGLCPNKYLEKLCRDGISKRYGKSNDIIEKRLKFELEIIKNMNFASYFLVVQDFVNWAKKQKIVVGPGRGSAAGSLISYLIGITDVDPIKYNLLFERFLNPDRISMPDFDIDFADHRRDEVIKYVSQKYGEDYVAQIITFGTMAARAAIRDTGRALGLPYSFCDKVAKAIPMFTKLSDAVSNVKELKDLYNSDPEVKNLVDNAARLEGVARHSSTHACGVVISKEKIDNYTPRQYPPQDTSTIVTQYEVHDIDKLGLLKIDFLGLKNLTVIENAIKIISKTKGKTIDLSKIPLCDKKTIKLFQEGKTTGVFQFESSGMKRYLKKLKPTEFEDIVAMVALYRPGPLNSGMVDEFISRKNKRKKIVYKHPIMENALKNTYGVIVYQEQIMRLSRDMANFTGGQSDTLRKAVGKKNVELMSKMKKEFIEGCVKNNLGRKLAEETFLDMEKFAEYGFNRSHAVCYALIGYQTAYLKTYYPSEFMASLLTSDMENIDRIAIEVDECRRMGIEVLPVDINESFVNFGVVISDNDEKEKIRFGLSAIKNVGRNIAENIVEERKSNGKFLSVENFVSRIESKDLNKKSMESLIKIGAFDRMEERNKLLSNIEKILSFARERQKAKQSKQISLFGSYENSKINLERLNLVNDIKASRTEKMSWEKELLGLYVSDHPLKEYSGYLRENFRNISDLSKEDAGKIIKIGGILIKTQRTTTRSGQSMMFATIEDLSGKIEIIVFPKLLERQGEIFKEGAVVSIKGRINDRDDSLKIIAENAEEINTEKAKQYSSERIANINNANISKININDISRENKKSKNFENYFGNYINIKIPFCKDSKSAKSIMKKLLDAVNLTERGEYQVYVLVPSFNRYQKIKTQNKIVCGVETLKKIRDIVGNENVEVGTE